MNRKENDIIVVGKDRDDEAEEIMPVSSSGLGHSPFKGKIASSNLVAGTLDRDGWRSKDACDNFNIKKIDTTVAGREYSRLSVLQ